MTRRDRRSDKGQDKRSTELDKPGKKPATIGLSAILRAVEATFPGYTIETVEIALDPSEDRS